MRTSAFLTTGSILFSALAPSALAIQFPDVPSYHQFQDEIDQLSDLGVIGGNPSGNFLPDNPVNRAEFLKMTYEAASLSPDASARWCFPDVQPGSWYEPYVCDAESRGFVQGYPDGQFRPQNVVNRVEALAIITKVFGINIPELSPLDYAPPVGMFRDLDLGAWYAPSIAYAYNVGILPVPGQSSTNFGPASMLSRGEAAAYIMNTINRRAYVSPLSSQSSSRSTSTSVSSRPQTSVEEGELDAQRISFPFTNDGRLDRGETTSYTFSLSSRKTVFFEFEATRNDENVTCTLYRIANNGFSLEYYPGWERARGCQVFAALDRGEYQIDVRGDGYFTGEGFEKNGDNNDGFVEAPRLTLGGTRSNDLLAGDIADFYYFTIPDEQTRTLTLSNESNFSCLIYPMADVDLYGFSGPICNESYTYPPGTYYVGVYRRAGIASQQSYTLRMQ